MARRPSDGSLAIPAYEQRWREPEQQRSDPSTRTLQNPFKDPETRSLSRRPTIQAGQLRGLGATRRTRWKNVARVFPRWFMTVVLAGCISAVLISYNSFAVMSKTEKRQFNAIITGLSIALGFSISSSLNAMVGNLRWWILSRRYRSRRKVELILQADSLTHLIKMAYKSHRISIHTAVLLWVFVIIGSQIAVASLGFCFSTDTAEKNALMEDGQILLADMSSIGTDNIISDGSASLAAQQYVANRYVKPNGFNSLHFVKCCIAMELSRAHTLWVETIARYHPQAPSTTQATHSCFANGNDAVTFFMKSQSRRSNRTRSTSSLFSLREAWMFPPNAKRGLLQRGVKVPVPASWLQPRKEIRLFPSL
jgi:phosphate/sulfate permease